MSTDVTVLCGSCKSEVEEITYIASGFTDDSTLTCGEDDTRNPKKG